MFNKILLSTKIWCAVCVTAIVTGTVFGFSNYGQFKSSVEIEINQRMSTLVESRKLELEGYLSSVRRNMHFLSEDPIMVSAVNDFDAAWKSMQMDGVNVEAFLQKHYVGRGSVGDVDDVSAYGTAHKKYDNWLKHIIQDFEYQDVFLFNLHGDLLYEVREKQDLGTNLLQGEWSATALGAAFQKSASQRADHDAVFISDLGVYPPGGEKPVMFISTPLINDREAVVGVLVVAINIDNLNGILHNPHGLHDNDDVYLLGADKRLRSGRRLASEAAATNGGTLPAVVLQSLQAGGPVHHSGISAKNSQGVPTVQAFSTVEFGDNQWVLVYEIVKSTLYAQVDALFDRLILQGIAIIMLLVIIGYVLSQKMTRNIGIISSVMQQIADGQHDVEIPFVEDSDEIGDVARALVQFQAMDEHKTKLERMLAGMSQPIMVCNQDFDVSYINLAMMRLLESLEKHTKINYEDILGTNLGMFQKYLPQNSGVRLASSTDLPCDVKCSIGDEWLEIHIEETKNRKGNFNGVFVTWNMITEQVKTEESVKAAQMSINELIGAASAGDLSMRIDARRFDGFYRELAESMNNLMNTVIDPMTKAISTLQQFAKGDLTVGISGEYGGAFKNMQNAVNSTIDNLQVTVSDVKDVTESVSFAVDEISAGSSNLAMRTESQASSLEETAASMAQLTGVIQSTAKNASKARDVSLDACEIARVGGEVVEDAIEAMTRIEGSSKKISDIIGVIDEIAFQTNLLALNAAVEAARAGEAGKGFAVVASEVRSLAGRSSSASKEIKLLIKASVDQVDQGSGLVRRAGKTLDDIVGSVARVAGIIGEIAAASQEQSDGVREVNAAVVQMDEMTQQNAVLVEKTNVSVKALSKKGRELNQLMEGFKVDGKTNEMAKSAAGMAPSSSGPAKNADIVASDFVASNASQKTADHSSSSTIAADGWEEF